VEQPHERRRRLGALVRDEPVLPDDRAGTPGVLRRLCTAVTRDLSVQWAGVTLVEDQEVGGTVAGSDHEARALEDLQFELGEGPCVDAVAYRRPVLVPDLGETGFRRWPAYGPAAHELGARSVFAFPLQVGGVCVGALDIYRPRSGSLPPDVVTSALAFADLAMDMLVGSRGAAYADADVAEIVSPRLEVYQAQGMVAVDVGVSLTTAMALLRAHAFTSGRPLVEIAREVLDGRLRLEL
jgi:hypothetical protein